LRGDFAGCQGVAAGPKIAPMDFRAKIVAPENLRSWREAFQSTGKKLVATNGCFDILHIGHASYLEAARNCGDALLVGVNDDNGVRQLKGPGRPVNGQEDRAGMVAALEAVDAVFIFTELRAVEFLKIARPDIYVKGGDYTVETIPQDERRVVEGAGGKIVFLPFVPGKSPTSLIRRLDELPARH
jgi:rfaE bifunctional protein nucleotidyltransferase chain/domain